MFVLSIVGTVPGFNLTLVPREAAVPLFCSKQDSSKWHPHNMDVSEGFHLGRCLRTNRTHLVCLSSSFFALGKLWIDTPSVCWPFLQLTLLGLPATQYFPLWDRELHALAIFYSVLHNARVLLMTSRSSSKIPHLNHGNHKLCTVISLFIEGSFQFCLL
jgi:hypothetical protein